MLQKTVHSSAGESHCLTGLTRRLISSVNNIIFLVIITRIPQIQYTAKPVLRGHIWDNEKVAL